MVPVLILAEAPLALKFLIVLVKVFLIVTVIATSLILMLVLAGIVTTKLGTILCGYFLVTNNEELKTDIPIYLRLVQAFRYDGVTAIVALSEARLLYPDFIFDKFIGDSAHDNILLIIFLMSGKLKLLSHLIKRIKIT